MWLVQKWNFRETDLLLQRKSILVRQRVQICKYKSNRFIIRLAFALTFSVQYILSLFIISFLLFLFIL